MVYISKHIINVSLIFIITLIYDNPVISQNVVLSYKEYNSAISEATFVYDIYDSSNIILNSGFDISNKEGIVRIDSMARAEYIVFEIRHLSYKSIINTYRIDELPDTIFMEQSSIRLNEIVIKHEDDYNAKKVITFDVDAAKSIQTRKFSQLLNNISEIDVDEFGINYKNQRIGTVLIDSMDISGNQYMDVVNVLPTVQFQQFQIIKNYYKNPVDKGFKEGVIALNIKTKDLSKMQIGLSGSQSIDSRIKSDLDIDLFANSKEVKVLALGRRRQIETGYLSFRDLKEGPIYRKTNFGRSNWSTEIDVDNSFIPLDEFDNWCYDETYSGTKVQAGFITKAQGLHNLTVHYGDNNYEHSELEYFEQNYLTGVWRYNTNTAYDLKSTLFGLEYDFEKAGTSSFINYGGHYIVPSYTSKSFALQTGDLNGDLVHQIQSEPDFSSGFFFDYSRSAGLMAKHQLKANLELDKKNVIFIPDSNRVLNFFPTEYMISENLSYKKREWYASYLYTKKLGKYSGEIGSTVSRESINKSIAWNRHLEIDTLENESISSLNEGLLILRLYPQSTLNMRYWISVNFESGYTGIDLDHKLHTTNKCHIPFDIELKIGKKIKDWNILTLQYQFKRKFPSLQYNYPTFIVNSNYYQLNALDDWSNIIGHDFLILYKTGGWADLTSFQMSLGYLHNPIEVTENTQVNIDYAKQTFYYGPQDRVHCSGSFDGLLLNLPISYGINLTASYGQNYSTLNDREVHLKNYMFYPGFEVELETNNFNIRLTGDISHSVSKVNDGDRYSNTTTYYGMDFEFNSTDKIWKARWANRFRFRNANDLQFPGGSMTLTRYFIGFDISCWINNLYNANYEIIDISPLTKSASTIPLNPRSLGIRLRWDL